VSADSAAAQAPPSGHTLDGVWRVVRTGGLLPPLVGVRKRIANGRGVTSVGPLPGARFTVDGSSLIYRTPFRGFVDVLTPDADGFRGRALFRGREYGRFVLRRAAREA
jgi:hypothetical protein